MSLQKEPCTQHFSQTCHEKFIEVCCQPRTSFTLMPYFCRVATLTERRAGGTEIGTPQEVRMAGLKMSHNGRQWLASAIPETVHARHGQQKKP